MRWPQNEVDIKERNWKSRTGIFAMVNFLFTIWGSLLNFKIIPFSPQGSCHLRILKWYSRRVTKEAIIYFMSYRLSRICARHIEPEMINIITANFSTVLVLKSLAEELKIYFAERERETGGARAHGVLDCMEGLYAHTHDKTHIDYFTKSASSSLRVFIV